MPRLSDREWDKVDAVFNRFSGGDGKWVIRNKKILQGYTIEIEEIPFIVKPTDFGHLGIFPEQMENWVKIGKLISVLSKNIKEFNVLNLFAYTGGATMAAAISGAKVVHVDASKTSVEWAKKNVELCGRDNFFIRWIVDDVKKFVSREIRKGSKYHGIILDPPSFGRGTKNELWKIEEDLNDLLFSLGKLFAEDFSFLLLSSHSNGYTPEALKNLVCQVTGKYSGYYDLGEMLLCEKDHERSLPSGASCLFIREIS
ncbi:MAG: class I SAM-dependent methyltransferase [Oligoflexales bacterium]|nr:class I SAM-dependent methyltransferase [Oligoflexales bacterium]